MEKKLLTVPEAAKVANIGRDKAYELSRTGNWPAIRIGRQYRIPVAALDRWIEREVAKSMGEELSSDPAA